MLQASIESSFIRVFRIDPLNRWRGDWAIKKRLLWRCLRDNWIIYGHVWNGEGIFMRWNCIYSLRWKFMILSLWEICCPLYCLVDPVGIWNIFLLRSPFCLGGATFFCDLRRDFYSLRPLCCSCCRREKIFRGEIAAATDWNRYTSGHSFGCLGPKVALCVPQHKVRLRLGEFSLFSI